MEKDAGPCQTENTLPTRVFFFFFFWGGGRKCVLGVDKPLEAGGVGKSESIESMLETLGPWMLPCGLVFGGVLWSLATGKLRRPRRRKMVSWGGSVMMFRWWNVQNL